MYKRQVLAVAAAQKGYILPVCLTLIYTFLGFILLMVNMYLHPVSYTHLEFQLVADPLPLFAFFSHNLRVKIPFHGKSADLNQLDHHRQARNRTLIQMCIRDSPSPSPATLPP